MSFQKADEAPTELLGHAASRVESIRKDSECVFGISKARFRVLRVPTQLHDYRDVDDMFRTCMILHNMLLQYYGMDDLGDRLTDWRVDDSLEHDGSEPLDVDMDGITDGQLHEDIVQSDVRARLSEVDQLVGGISDRIVLPSTDLLLMGNQSTVPATENEIEVDQGFEERQDALAVHMHQCYEKGELMWLKKASECRADKPPYGAPGPWNA